MPAVPTRTAPGELPSAAANPRFVGCALLLGLALTLTQTVAVAALSGQPTLVAAYRSLYQWDSVWYAHIAEHGYPDHVPDRPGEMQKVGFFPGTPLFARLVMTLTGLPGAVAVLVAAQLACWGFWVYLLLFLRRWQTPLPAAVACVVAVLAHPSAFFLVAGYSESLFLFGVLGFFYWQSAGTRLGWALAAAHGVLLTVTRIVGIPLVVVPLAVAVVDQLHRDAGTQPRPGLTSGALLGAVAALGGVGFFVYCQMHVGRWDVYFHVQNANWGVKPDYLAIFRPETYRFVAPGFIDGTPHPNWISRICVPVTALLFLVLALVEARHARQGDGWRQRLGLYLSAGLMFYLAVSGLASLLFVSMVRYTFCVHVLLALAVTHLSSEPAVRTRPLWAWPLLGGATLAGVLLQVLFVRLYTHGQWVA